MKKKELDDRLSELFPEEDSGKIGKEIDELGRIYNLLMNDTEPDPPGSLDDRFYELIKEEVSRGGRVKSYISGIVKSGIFIRSIRVAAGIALFLLGWFGASWLGNDSGSSGQVAQLASEVGQLRETLILTMIENSSPAERIQAVNMVNDVTGVDQRITSGLLNVLGNDPNDNVRLVALETLVGYADDPVVREGLIRSIGRQTSPLIQLRLAEIMVVLEEKRSVEEFEKILSDITLDYSVRDQLNQAVEVLL